MYVAHIHGCGTHAFVGVVCYSFVTRLLFVCTRMLLVCTRMYSCGVLVTINKRQLQKTFCHLMRDVSLPL